MQFISSITRTAERCRNKSQSSKAIAIQDAQNEGFIYPPDLWHVLGDYIQPSEVGRFASICRFAYEVTKTYRFWMHLYVRLINIILLKIFLFLRFKT